uniref:7TM_GPCR_Srx domain-containing protein n=1 Tax=Haemonchus contortus TaxID=6289 RepID=A0A7I4YPM4_HAECO
MLASKSSILKSAFFRIFIVTGIFDILGLVALEWTRAEAKNSFGPSFELPTRVAMNMTGINFITHIFGCFLMTLNRFTAVCYPHRHQQIWCSRNVLTCLIIEIVISVLIHIQAFQAYFVYKPSPNGGWIRVGRSFSINGLRITESALTIGYEVVSIVLISYTIYAMNKQLRASGHKLTQDMSLVFVTTINCVISMIECIYDVSFLLKFRCRVIDWITDQYDLNFFLIMTTNAFTIIFLSHTLREEFLQRWRNFQLPRRTSRIRTSVTIPFK